MPALTFEQIHQKLVEKFGDAVGPLSPPKKDPFCVFSAPRLREICGFLKDSPELYFDFLEDLTATDHQVCRARAIASRCRWPPESWEG